MSRADPPVRRPGPSPADEDDHLRRLFAETLRQHPAHDVTPLRDAVCEFVRRRRAAGARAEQVVVAVKRIAAHVPIERDVEVKAARQLAESLVRWCIEEYYGTQPPPRAD